MTALTNARRPHRVLVVQGGGMRGAYAAGALTELFGPAGIHFDAVWATSSGSASAAYGIAGQMEGLDIWRDHLHGSRLASIRKGLLGRPFLDLDYLIDEVFQRRIPLDAKRLRAAGVPLWVPVTNLDRARVEYLDVAASDPFPVLRAAMSVPGAVRIPVEIDGQRYVDGGVIDQIPVGAAFASGAAEVFVVLTRPAGFVQEPIGRFALRLATRPFPTIAPLLRERHLRHRAELETLAQPPAGTKVHVIRPSPTLLMGRWTRRRSRLIRAIEAGQQDARNALSAIPSKG